MMGFRDKERICFEFCTLNLKMMECERHLRLLDPFVIHGNVRVTMSCNSTR